MIREMASRPPNAPRLLLDSLTERQLKVLRLIGDGYSNPQIAEQLSLSINTVESYSARLKEKLGLATANELLQYAIKFNKAVGD